MSYLISIVETWRQSKWVGWDAKSATAESMRWQASAVTAQQQQGQEHRLSLRKQQPQAACHQAQGLLHVAAATTTVIKSCNIPCQPRQQQGRGSRSAALLISGG
jgi:hypothetical protein